MFKINKLGNDEEVINQRREFLSNALGAGAFTAVGASGILMPEVAKAQFFGKVPKRMPSNKSFYEINGRVSVNGRQATEQTFVETNDEIITGSNSSAIFVVGADSFILRENSRLQLSGSSSLLDGMRMLSGRLLAVFGKRRANQQQHLIRTQVATIGIRGTGVYCESDPDKTYLCTCYGVVDMAANADKGASKARVEAFRHDEPKYILKDGARGKKITSAPFINHTDEELLLIETLVGRKPPYSVGADDYSAPRRAY